MITFKQLLLLAFAISGSVEASAQNETPSYRRRDQFSVLGRYSEGRLIGNVSDQKRSPGVGLSLNIENLTIRNGEAFGRFWEMASAQAVTLEGYRLKASKTPGYVLVPEKDVRVLDLQWDFRPIFFPRNWVSPFLGVGLGYASLSQDSGSKRTDMNSFSLNFSMGGRFRLPLGFLVNLIAQSPFGFSFAEKHRGESMKLGRRALALELGWGWERSLEFDLPTVGVERNPE